MRCNQLASSTSPYLLQHKNNPVAWQEWHEDIFKQAADEHKPIFLSIGYSTCHWCHVMAHQSFEDQEVADLLNKNFISVKLDREERPDLDQLYMTVCQMMTGRGGWPLTVLLTPDKRPFFAGTYFPKKSTPAQPGLMDILGNVTQLWQTEREALISQSNKIVLELVQKNLPSQTEASLEPSLTAGYAQLEKRV